MYLIQMVREPYILKKMGV